VIQLTRVIVLGLMRGNIQVNALCSGYILTEFNRYFFKSEASKDLIKKMIPLNRVGTLNELKSTALYLARVRCSRQGLNCTSTVDTRRSVMKRISLKYCGGCDCTYDRLEYAEKLKNAAEGRIEWVSQDDGEFDTILMIHGCHVACLEEKLEPGHPWRIISVIDDRVAPEKIINKLLERGEK